MNASGETRKGFPLTLPLPCDMRGCEQQNLRVITKRKTTLWVVFLFGMPRAGWNTLPRPARSASNLEVKAGLPRMALPFVGCREASSSLVYFAAQSAKTKKYPIRQDGVFFLECAAGRLEFAASTSAKRVKPFRRGRRPRRPVSAAVPRWERIPTSLRAAKQVPLGYSSE